MAQNPLRQTANDNEALLVFAVTGCWYREGAEGDMLKGLRPLFIRMQAERVQPHLRAHCKHSKAPRPV